jgi:predicted HicB family RNase H-like nuclease
MSTDKTLKVRVSDYEYEQLKLESEKQGVSMSDAVRKYIGLAEKDYRANLEAKQPEQS